MTLLVSLLAIIFAQRLADFTVIESDFRALPPKQWLSMPVRMTIVDGKFVYAPNEPRPWP